MEEGKELRRCNEQKVKKWVKTSMEEEDKGIGKENVK